MANSSYNGTIDLISGLRPKNGQTFPLVQAKDVLVGSSGDVRLDSALAGVDTANGVKNYVDAETTRAEGVEGAHNTRITALETAVGTGGSVDSKIAAAVDPINTAIGTDSTANTIKGRIKALENVGATKVEDGANNGEIKVDGSTVTVYDDSALVSTIGADTTSGTVKGRIKVLEDAVGSNGSVDTRIAAAVAAETSNREADVDAEETRAKAAEAAEASTRASAITAINTEIGTDATANTIKGRLKEVEDQADQNTSNIAALNSPFQVIALEANLPSTDQNKMYICEDTGDWYYWDTTNSEYVSGGSAAGVHIDTTLKTAGAAADAKATGDAISELSSELDTTQNDIDYYINLLEYLTNISMVKKITEYQIAQTGHVSINGMISSNDQFWNTDYIECSFYKFLIVVSSMKSFDGNSYCVGFYDIDKSPVGVYPFRKNGMTVFDLISVPSGAYYFKYTCTAGVKNNNNINNLLYGVYGDNESNQQFDFKGAFKNGNYIRLQDNMNHIGVLTADAEAEDGYHYIETSTYLNWFSTDFYIVQNYDTIYLYFDNSYNDMRDSSGINITWFDKNKKWLSQNTIIYGITVDGYSMITAPPDTRYVMFSIHSATNIKVIIKSMNMKPLNLETKYFENLVDVTSFYTPFFSNRHNNNVEVWQERASLPYESRFQTWATQTSESQGLWLFHSKPIRLYPGETLLTEYGDHLHVIIARNDSTVSYSKEIWLNDSDNGTTVHTYKNTYSHILDFYFSISIIGALFYVCKIPDDYDENKYRIELSDNVYKSSSRFTQYEHLYHSVKNIINNNFTDDETLIGTFDDNRYIFYKGDVMIKNYDQIADRLLYYSSSERDLNIVVGLVDQWNKLIVESTYTVPITIGENIINLASKDIIIPAGYVIAFDVVAGDECLNRNCNYPRLIINTFIDLEDNNTITSNFMKIPAALITLRKTENDETINNLSNQVQSLSADISSIKSNSNKYKYIYENDTLYRVYIKSDFSISTKSKVVPDKYLAIGNSITMHGIREEVNWLVDDRGMAATRQEYDYVHRLSSVFSNANSNYELIDQINLSQWETAWSDRASTLSTLDTYLNQKPDLVTIQLAENASNIDTFQEDYVELIQYIQTKSPNTFIICLGAILGSVSKTALIKSAAEECDVQFIDFTNIYTLPNFKSAMGTTIYKANGETFTVTHSGVAGHPGDEGFRLIAQEILRVIYADSSLILN